MRVSIAAVILLTAALGAAPYAQTAKPVTMTDVDTLAGHKAMSLDVRIGDKSLEREVRAHLDARMKELGITVLPPGQPPIFRVELDTELISSERTLRYMFYNVVAEFVVPVADPRNTTKIFLSPSWRSRHSALVESGSFQPVPVPLRQATGDFAAAYKKANGAAFALTRSPVRQLRSTDKEGLLAAVGQPVVVTGRVTSLERIYLNGNGLHLYLVRRIQNRRLWGATPIIPPGNARHQSSTPVSTSAETVRPSSTVRPPPRAGRGCLP